MPANNDFILPFLHKEFSAATCDWTDTEVGAYIRLLMVQWDQGSIPEDINRLRKIADSIDQTQDVVLLKFKKAEQIGRLQNLRMEEIREERKIFHAGKSQAGKKGMSKRWQVDNKTITDPITKGYQKDNKGHNKRVTFNNEVEVEVEVKGDNEVKVEAEEKKIPPSRFNAQQIFSINKPDHWSTEYMESEVDAWFDHYNANGWKVGREKMRDWKATIRTWIRNDYNFKKSSNGNTGTDKKPWRNGTQFDEIAKQFRGEETDRPK